MKIKETFYDVFVRKNGRVWYEYERYVREHSEEHKTNKAKHYLILLKLNWFYRIRKGNTPYFYWDTPLDPNIKKANVAKDIKQGQEKATKTMANNKALPPQKVTVGNPWIYPEISCEKRLPVEELVNKLLPYDVISFDVFDTLIFRYVSNPKDVFSLTGNRLGIFEYSSVRVRAEEDARKNSDNLYGEVTLDEIYDYVSSYLGVDKSTAMDMELKVEREVCFPNPYMKKVVDTLIANGKRVIATSNMYLNSMQIQDLLNNCGYDCIQDVYSSCDYGVSKSHGILQEKVWDLIGREKSVIHVGDNYSTDYIGSRMAGWKAYYYKNVNEIGNNYRPAKISKLLGSVYGGIVNSHFHCGINDDESIFYELGFAYLGILIVGYCKWINEFAKRNSITKLLFSSRDMCLVYKLYKQYYQEVDCDYIKVSRFAAQRFSYNRFSDYFIDSHIKARALIAKLTIADVLQELDICFMQECMSNYGLESETILSMDNFDLFRKCLNDNKKLMLENFKEEKEASIKYYKQFLEDGDRIGIVDLGWQGTNALCLKYLFEEEMDMDLDVKSLLMVSFGSREFVSNSFSEGIADAFCFSARKNEQLCNQFSPTKMGRFICELLFSSNEQSLKKISVKEDGEFEFSYIQNEKRDAQNIDDMYRGAEAFVDLWEKSNVYKGVIEGFDAILPLNKLSYSDICFDIMDGNEINPWIGETKASAASNIRKLVR